METIRGSEIYDFLRCRLRWKYRWVDKLVPKQQDGKLFFGTLFHKFVEVLYNTSDAEKAYQEMVELFNQTDTTRMEQTELDGLLDLVTQVTTNYVQQWHNQNEHTKTIATELRFAIPLDDQIVYEGTIDRIFLDSDNRIWFSDYKTTTSIERYDKNTEMDRQISRYWWALQQLQLGNGYIWNSEQEVWIHVQEHRMYEDIKDKQIAGFMYDIVLKDYPRPPKELKKGGLSKDKSQKTTYNMYLDTLKSHYNSTELDEVWDDYKDILDHLQQQESEYGNRFFRRIPVTRSQEELQAAIQEFYHQAKESRVIKKSFEESDSLGYNPIHRNITIDCHWDCPYQSLCVASMDGSNINLLIDLAYEKEE